MNERNHSLNNCKICSKATYTLDDSELNLFYRVCESCGYTYKDEQFIVSHDQEKSLYNHHVNTMENEGYVNMFKRFLAESVDPFIQTGKALDFGSGPGPVLYELLLMQGYEANHYDPYYHDDPSVLTKRYDLITSTEVFEHLSNPVQTLERLVNMLNPGGYLAIMTSFRMPEDEQFLKWWYRRDQTHIGFFTQKAFEMLIKPYALTIVHTNHKNMITLKKSEE